MNQTILSTGLFSDSQTTGDMPDAKSFLLSSHLSLVTPLIENQQGAIAHSSSKGVSALFNDPVRAVLCAVQIQKAHHHWKEGPTPPRIRVVVCTGNELSPQSVELQDFMAAAGKGEILVCPETATFWREDGNRELLSRTLSGSLGTGFVVLWEAPSREPKRLVRQRGWLFIGMVALPSLLILLYSLLEMPASMPPFKTNIVLWGPLWNGAQNLGCPLQKVSSWTIIEDHDLSRHEIRLNPGRKFFRLTGFIRQGTDGPEAVLDRIDAAHGRHELRLSSSCPQSDVCTCFARMVPDVLASPAATAGTQP